jgi:hypothetical protein
MRCTAWGAVGCNATKAILVQGHVCVARTSADTTNANARLCNLPRVHCCSACCCRSRLAPLEFTSHSSTRCGT